MNFIIFLCVTLKLFFLTFVPLLAPNLGDANTLLLLNADNPMKAMAGRGGPPQAAIYRRGH